jgi:SAM-dependent methyltransferase
VNHHISDVAFEYRRCERCGTLFLVDPPADLGSYYPEGYYGLDALDDTEPTEQAKLELVLRHVGRGRLVEIGPGAGGFARAASRHGFGVTGVEMDERACRHLRDEIGVEAVRSDDPAAALTELDPADAICAWHAIEHLADPWALVDAAASRLRPGGVLVIATPNPDALQLRLLGARWTHVDAPRHLSLIPAGALIERGRRAGLEPVEVITHDRTANDWNAFGWQRLLAPRLGGLAPKAGSALALLLAPLERSGRRSTAYTAVFRNNPSG